MVLENTALKRSGRMTAPSPTTRLLGRVRCDTATERLSPGTSKTAKSMDSECTNGRTALPLKVGTLMIGNRAMESFEAVIIRLLKANGETVSAKGGAF